MFKGFFFSLLLKIFKECDSKGNEGGKRKTSGGRRWIFVFSFVAFSGLQAT